LTGSRAAANYLGALTTGQIASLASDPGGGIGLGQRPRDVLEPLLGRPLSDVRVHRGARAAAAAEVCLVVGTTGAVYPAAAVVHETRGAGGKVIVVDPGETAYDDVADVRLWGAAGEVVPALVAEG
jgi:NAD-dependent SIR2 family protein deacetylase